jgi:NAD(P)H-hydrate epimerase
MLASHPAVCAIAVGATPEIVTVPLADSPEGIVDEKGVEQIVERLDRVNAIALGPGLTRHAAAADAVRMLVGKTRLPMVLDADGLNAFEGGAGALARRGSLVLTPHEGEFARLSGAPVRDRMRDALALAERTNAVVLLKGTGTVIASPDGRIAINPTGGVRLASAGTGDVLTGMIVALLARGVHAFEAAACAAWLHGSAAHACGSETPSASEVMNAIPAVLP